MFEINFLLDISPKHGSKTPSAKTPSANSTPHKRAKHAKQFWNRGRAGSRSKHGSRRHSLTEDSVPNMLRQRSNASQTPDSKTLTHQDSNERPDHQKAKGFLPYQADNHEIWTDPEPSRTPSSTIEFIHAPDYKPSDYDENWRSEIIPKLEGLKQLSVEQRHADKWSTTAMNGGAVRDKPRVHGLGHDRYLVHTVRYSAKSPEDCCQIVRKIQHLMLLENQAIYG